MPHRNKRTARARFRCFSIWYAEWAKRTRRLLPEHWMGCVSINRLNEPRSALPGPY